MNISHLTKHLINDRFLLKEYLKEGIINYAALAEKLKPKLDAELGRNVKISSIAMALRRYSEKPKDSFKQPSVKHSELILKSNLCDVTVYKSPALFEKLKKIYEIVNYNEGDTLNIVHGNYDVSIVINEKYMNKVLGFLEEEKILHIEKDLNSIIVKFGIDLLYTPGVTFTFLQQLVEANVNIIEIMSTLVEVNFIINKRDSVKSYRALQELIEK